MRKYFRAAEIIETLHVSADLIESLEHESLIGSVMRGNEKLFPLREVDRIRVVHILIGEMGVNLAGVEVALHMRAQIIALKVEAARTELPATPFSKISTGRNRGRIALSG